MSYSDDKKFAEKFIPQITTILKNNAKHIVSIVVAPYEDDALRATDIIIKVESGDVAVRLRREGYLTKYRDLTIRSRRTSGATTELEKLKHGFARWYLYGWTSGNNITSWALIDLDIVRKQGIFNRSWPEFPNKDRCTFFVAIPMRYLEENYCVIASDNIVTQKSNPTSATLKRDLHNQVNLHDWFERAT